MKIANFEVRALKLPFKVSFSHALATRNCMDSILLVLKTDCGIYGYGEGTPRLYVTGESLDDSIHFLEGFLSKHTNLEFNSPDDIFTILSNPSLQGRPSVSTALELALLDILGKSEQRTVQSYFGPLLSDELIYSAVISSESITQVQKMLKMAAALSMKDIKLKFGKDLALNLEMMDLVKEMIPAAIIRGDANACWCFEEAMLQIPTLAEKGAYCFEQPLAVAAKANYPRLVKALDGQADIMVDESLLTLADAKWFIENRACHRMLLKVSKNGGIFATLHLARYIENQGLKVHLGSHVGESSILSAAGRIVAAHHHFETIEGSFGTLLLEEDLTETPLQFGKGGKAASLYSNLPGMGILIRNEQVQQIV